MIKHVRSTFAALLVAFAIAFSLVAPGGSVRPVSAASTEPNQPPVVTAPAHTLPVGQNGPDTIPVVLSWSATDNDGIAGYELQQSADGGNSFTNVPLPTSCWAARLTARSAICHRADET